MKFNKKFYIVFTLFIIFITLLFSFFIIDGFYAKSATSTSTQSQKLYNICNRRLYLYYPFDENMKNWATAYQTNNFSNLIDDTSNENVKIDKKNTIFKKGSLYLNGNNSYLKLPKINIIESGFTIAMWIKIDPSSLTNRSRIFEFSNGPNTNNFSLGFQNKQIYLYMNQPYNGKGTSASGLATGYYVNEKTPVWHHIAFTVSDLNSKGNCNLFVDGKNTGFKFTSYPSKNYDITLIGKSQNSKDGYLHANINALIVFDRALDSTEIINLYNYPKSITFTSDKEYCKNAL